MLWSCSGVAAALVASSATDVTDNNLVASSGPISLEQFKLLAENSVGSRCHQLLSLQDFKNRLSYAVEHNFITARAATWGLEHRFVPVINFQGNQLAAVCPVIIRE
jgi:hypothetical protein